MKWTTTISHLIKEIELRKSPIIIRVNKFDEENAKKFRANRENWMQKKLKQGEHPDTHPDFWKGFKDEPPLPANSYHKVTPFYNKQSFKSSAGFIALLIAGIGGLILRDRFKKRNALKVQD